MNYLCMSYFEGKLIRYYNLLFEQFMLTLGEYV